MTLKKLVVAGFAVAALMMPSFGAIAQDAAPAAPAEGAAAPATPAAPADGAAAPAAPAANANPATNWLKVCDPIDLSLIHI